MARTLQNIAALTGQPSANAPGIVTASLPDGQISQLYSQSLAATGAPPITWTIQSGILPTGLALDGTTGVISGIPTVNGSFNFTLRAQNAAGHDTRAFTIVIGTQGGSGITLPNRRLTTAERNNWIADYNARGGATAVELEVIRLVNIERANRNLTPVELDAPLMMAARFFAQQHHDLRDYHTGWGHNFGPYATNAAAQHGASANVAQAFGATLRWNGGNAHSSGTSTAQAIVNGWMNSTGHRNYILSPEHRFIGVGQFPGGISYMFLNDRASAGTAQFTITFNNNGGSGTMQTQNFNQGVAQNLRNNTFTRTGYVFAGWSATRTGPVRYTNNQRITVTSSQTLYAVWTRGYTVTFNANGGTGTMDPQVFQRNVAQNLRSNTFTRAGFTFGGWSTTASGSAQYNNNQSMTITANRTLFAVWVPSAPVITTASLPGGMAGRPYSQQQLAATGATPITWRIIGGSLPPGLNLSAGGVVHGTPTAQGVSHFSVEARNNHGFDTRTFSITVSTPSALSAAFAVTAVCTSGADTAVSGYTHGQNMMPAAAQQGPKRDLSVRTMQNPCI